MVEYSVKGVVKNSQGFPISNIMIQVMDNDQKWYEDRNDDMIGSTWTDEDGIFEILFDKDKFKDSLLENDPEVYLVIRNSFGQIINTTEPKKAVPNAQEKQNNIDFEIILVSTEKVILATSSDPYAENNQRVISAFQKLGDVSEFQLSDISRVLRLFNTSINAWSLYTADYIWDTIGYDGPQVPRYPWRIPNHSHELSWNKEQENND